MSPNQCRSAMTALAVACLAGCTSPPQKAAAPGIAATPARTCDVSRYGAMGDGVTKDTAALQRAIDDCATGDGGTVLLARGTFLSGTIRLRSHVTLRIEAGATLLGSRDDADYPVLPTIADNKESSSCRRALVVGDHVEKVRIEGGGTIDGNADIDKWRSMARPEGERPMAIFTAGSHDVDISGITVRNAATWAVVNMEVNVLRVHGITVDSPLGPTHDGIDVVDGRFVTIEDNTINAGDDAICLKSGSARGLRDVLVRRNHVLGAGVANGLKLGTATVGPMTHIAFEDIVIEHVQAAAMAVESVDGGQVSDVRFERITMNDVGTPVYVMLGARGPAAVGAIHDIRFANVRGSAVRYPWGALVSGAPADAAGRHDVERITFDDVDIAWRGAADAAGPHVFASTPADAARFPTYGGGYPDAKFLFATPTAKSEVIDYALPAYAFFVRNARGVRFDNCHASIAGVEHRDAVVTHDATVEGTCTR